MIPDDKLKQWRESASYDAAEFHGHPREMALRIIALIDALEADRKALRKVQHENSKCWDELMAWREKYPPEPCPLSELLEKKG